MHRFAEKGLDEAKKATAALFEGDFTILSALSRDEMKSIFVGAKVFDVMFEPGMTVLDLALKAQIYKHDRMYSLKNNCAKKQVTNFFD